MEEFADFSGYLNSIQSQCSNGICKIVPPTEWNSEWTYDKVGDLVIPSPIQQYVSGDRGVYQLMLVEGKEITVHDFQRMAEKDKIPKGPKYAQLEEVERLFWKNVRFNPPTYGADMSGSLMAQNNVSYWNLNHLDSILDVLGDIRIPGINVPYLYFGMWKAMFAWHVEDMNLFSINYLHFGEPKSWYAISPQHGPRLERLAQTYFPGTIKQIQNIFL
jgi:jumonji domain-containing protein 2